MYTIHSVTHEDGAFFVPSGVQYDIKFQYFVTYNGCVQAVKGLDIAVQSNNSLNLRKSLTVVSKVQKGTSKYMKTVAISSV